MVPRNQNYTFDMGSGFSGAGLGGGGSNGHGRLPLKEEDIQGLKLGQKVWMRVEVRREIEPDITLGGPVDALKKYRTEVEERLYRITVVSDTQALCEPIDHGGGITYIHKYSIDRFRRA